jgi:hypothetical protein
MFKNESHAVMSKAQKRYEALSEKRKREGGVSGTFPAREFASEDLPSIPSSSSGSESRRTASTVTRSGSPARPMTLSIENQALSFFAANNLLQPAVAGRGNYQWLFQMLSGSEIDATLQSSVHAASLATLATANKSQPLMKRAQEHYARALTLTNRALGDSIKVREDSTLVSVILLGVYENFVFEKHSLVAWMQHLKGAETLFALRGETQFRSDLARQIFVQFYRTTVSKSVELGTPVPDKIARLYRYLTSLNNYTMHGTS